MKAARIALACTGCSVGAGSAFVGQWRPRTERAFVACLEDDSGRCIETKNVDVYVPARRFWGYVFQFPGLGAAIVQKGDSTDTRFRLDIANEFIRGKGRFAWGIRAGVTIDIEQHTSTSVMGMGYFSLTERLTLRGGLGYCPFTRTHADVSEDSFVGGRALGGIQLAFTKTHSENFLILAIDVDRTRIQFDQPVDVTGIGGTIGVYF